MFFAGMTILALFVVSPVQGATNFGTDGDVSNFGTPGANSNIGTAGNNSSFTLENPLAHGSTLCELLNAVFSVTLTLGIPIAVVFVVIAGLKFVLALGNPTKLTNAKKNIGFTLLGIALFVGAWFLAQVIARTLLQLGGSGFNTCF